MNYNVLSDSILAKLDEVSMVFGKFQQDQNLICPTGCGKCCFSPEVSCAPYELLPLALHLLKTKQAESFLEKLKESKSNLCPLLEVTDEKRGMGRCLHYRYRPYLCRAFGASARVGKNNQTDLSVCSNFEKGDSPANYDGIPFIDLWKRKLEGIDPHLSGNDLPINSALKIILEKVLLWDSYHEKN